jgi:predicted acyltransferase
MPDIPKSPRLISIDYFRGLAIILMVLSNYSVGIIAVPSWFKHAQDIGLTINDIIAPLFIFAIGLTYGLSIRSRSERTSRWEAIQQAATRYLAILGLGAIISAGEVWYGYSPSSMEWGVLQAIGLAGLLALPTIFLPTGWRFCIGLGVLAIYQVLLDHFWLNTVLVTPHGGLPGSFGWAAMLILATALADLYHDPRKRKFYLVAVMLFLAGGISLAYLSPISKHRVSAAYVLVCLGISGLLFGLFHLLVEHYKIKLPLLAAWGKNPLLLYLLHYVLIGIFIIPGIPVLYMNAPAWLVILEMVILLVLLSWVAWILDRKHWYWKL